MSRKLTIEEFVIKAKKVHGNKYGYEKVIYKNNRTKVIITCPVHGDFLQTPDCHLKGQGCPKCKNEKLGDRYRATKEEFISKAETVHGDKYDYSKVKYTNNCTKVIITCPIHGEFLQSPVNHLQGKACPKCSRVYRPTTEEFIIKSKSVWGEDTFDYSKCVYKNVRTKVRLICKKHNNEFEQQPINHLQGQISCTECFYEKRSQYENCYWTYERCYETANKYEWLSDFRKDDNNCYEACVRKRYIKDFTWLKRHYDEDEDIITAQKHCIYKYDFPEYNTVYIGLTMDIDRRHNNGHFREGSVYKFCKENNLDIPKPQIIEDNLTLDGAKIREDYWIDYYKKQGYNLLNKANAGSVGTLCKVKTGNETALFIEKARKVHGDKYSYEKVVYEHSQTKVIITCPIHGEFEQQPNNHLQGSGCPKCKNEKIGNRRRKTLEEFITKSKEVHGNRYDYSKVDYINSETNVTITCPTHGEFKQIPNSHLKGQGCPKCSGNYKPTTEEFIERARKVHGDKYDYSKVVYKVSNTKINIVCLHHGDFLQEANSHLQGSGCPKCAKEKRVKLKTKWTYETCKAEAMKYRSRYSFNKGSISAYNASRKNKWLDKFFPKK